tara:strand:+ start:2787 stop:2984 length:198 start_codon:yes stop_codon:yes gene_type:complete
MPIYDTLDAKTYVANYAKPVVSGLNHLIDGGGLGDFQSAPGNPNLMPRWHNIDRLKNLRNGFKAL